MMGEIRLANSPVLLALGSTEFNLCHQLPSRGHPSPMQPKLTAGLQPDCPHSMKRGHVNNLLAGEINPRFGSHLSESKRLPAHAALCALDLKNKKSRRILTT